METLDARHLAYASHGNQLSGAGEPLVDHLERVAASVPSDAQTVAYLHDLLEHTSTSEAGLARLGVTPVELAAVKLLTRHPDESFELHALRIAYATGPEGRLARTVKLADIDDHVARADGIHPERPYGWARRHVATCRARLDIPPAAPSSVGLEV